MDIQGGLSTIRGRGRHALLLARLPRSQPGAEIGVWKGELSDFLLRWIRPSELHLVDPWQRMEGRDDALYGGSTSQDDMDAIHAEVARRLGSDPRVTIHRQRSVDAAAAIPDGHLAWVYIDGDHTTEGVLADLEAYLPKVRVGGVIVLDDFAAPGWWDNGPMRATAEFLSGAPVRFVGALFNQAVLVRTA